MIQNKNKMMIQSVLFSDNSHSDDEENSVVSLR